MPAARKVATVAPGNTTFTIATVEFFLTDGTTPFKIGNGVRETATGNLYRLVYGLDTFDYSLLTPNANNAYALLGNYAQYFLPEQFYITPWEALQARFAGVPGRG